MEPENLPIRVAAIFSSDGKIAPKWFELNRRKIEIKEMTYFWKDRFGEILLLHFAVTDGEANYELVFNTTYQTWSLNSIQPV